MAKILLGILVGGILGAILGLLPGFVLFDLIPKDPRTPLAGNPDYYFIRNKEFLICIGCLLGLFGGGLLGAITVATSSLLEASNRWYWVIARRPMGLSASGPVLTRPQIAEEASEDESRGRPGHLHANAAQMGS
jgi:hypothetical protein